MDLQPGQIVSHYRIEEKIGKGGMGVVYRATNLHLRSDVALKFLLPRKDADERAKRQFIKEARVLSRLSHPNIAVIHDFDRHDSIDFIVMEYVPGVTMNAMLSSGKIAEGEALGLLSQLLDGLSAAHESGVVHRDLKPGNLRVTPSGRLKILDFGLARLSRISETDSTPSIGEQSELVGTYPYMAPELFLGAHYDERSDIYSVGVVMYQIITGQLPFRSNGNLTLPQAILTEKPKDPRDLSPDLSNGLQRIILKTLAKDPGNRYQSADDLNLDLRSCIELPRATKQWHWKWTGALFLAVVSGIALVDFIKKQREAANFRNPQVSMIATWPGDEGWGRFSPDGSRISFQSSDGGKRNLWVMPIDGTRPELFDPQPENIISHVWAPDGKSIGILCIRDQQVFFQFVRFGEEVPYRSLRLDASFTAAVLVGWVGESIFVEIPGTGLYRLDPESGETEMLISARAEGIDIRKDFDVCEKGLKVVFAETKQSKSSIWKSDLNGANARKLTGDEDASLPRWMGNDGRRILYSSNETGQVEIWGLSLRSGRSYHVAFGSGTEFVELQDTSPDGTWAMFQKREHRADLGSIDVQPGATGTFKQLTMDDLRDMYPSISHDCDKLVFHRALPEPSRYGLTLGNQVLLSDYQSSQVKNPRVIAEIGGNARISPSGKWVAYVTPNPEAHDEMWLFETKNAHRYRVGQRVAASLYHMFPRDCLAIMLTWGSQDELFWVGVDPGAIKTIYRAKASVDELPSEKLVSANDQERLAELAVSPNGQWLAYVRTEQRRHVDELVCDNLKSGQRSSLLTYEHEWAGYLLCRGWLGEADSLVVLRTTVDPEFSQRMDVLLIERSGEEHMLGGVTRAFPGTAFLDRSARVLYLTRVDDDATTHNVYGLELSNGGLRRITDNVVPGVSFSGFVVASKEQIIASRQVRNMNLALIRFDR